MVKLNLAEKIFKIIKIDNECFTNKKSKVKSSLKLVTLLIGGFFASVIVAESQIQSKQSSQTSNLEFPVEVDAYLEKNDPKLRQELKKLLDRAIKDAENPTTDEISSNLWALSTNQQSKIRKTRIKDGKIEFLMVTWLYVDKNKVSELSNQKGKKYSFSNYVWVTAVPQVQEFCHSCKGLAVDIPGYIMLPLRLQQYLGLRLENVKTHFVEMWVKEDDLFRPCVDEEIHDFSCSVLPTNTLKNYPGLIDRSNRDRSYPWTGLGYTYDWGNSQKPHIGASEFVIKKTNQKKQVEVEIDSITPTEKYCSNQNLTQNNLLKL
ncbi:hypothetical protein [Synechocystis sp. PCC 7509]|uniref:hypothetical protein n=1 Tax=Synechocystis sp. PCC 7509 TaxID=927677 RepID=UPI0002ACB05A|nr:hypothetical protein [Synechocystis sp. PCC 7509]